MGEIGMPLNVAGVKKDLESWWKDSVDADPFAKPKQTPGTICDALPAVDSLSAEDAALTMGKHVPFSIPATIVRKGGYNDMDDMVNDLTSKLKQLADQYDASLIKKPGHAPATAKA
jgi:hypothetical protein